MTTFVPSIEYGTHTPDMWMSRYARFRAPACSGPCRLMGTIHNPVGADLAGNRLEIIVDGNVVGVVKPDPSQTWTPFSITLPQPASEEPFLNFIVRTSRFRTPSPPDQRLLGILLDDLRLECDDDAIVSEEAPPDSNAAYLNNLTSYELDAIQRLLDTSYIATDAYQADRSWLYPEEIVDSFVFQSPTQRAESFPFFDTDYYRSGLGAPLPASANPLSHFLRYGIQYLIPPHPLIDPAYIVRVRKDLFESKLTIIQFANVLIHDWCDPHPFVWLAWYRKRARLPGAKPALLHYLRQGAATNIPPNPYFDPSVYKSNRPGAPAAGLPLVYDFLLEGDRAQAKCGDRFDPRWYSTQHPEVMAASAGPLTHYLTIGRALGYKPLNDATPAVRTKATPPTGDLVYPELPSAILNSYADIESAVRDAQRARLVKFKERNICPFSFGDVELKALDLRFDDEGGADVDILVPVYNEFEITAECLLALRHMKTKLRIRVFLLDDASTDPRMAEFAEIPGLIVVRHTSNLHFLRSCNVGFERTTAPYVLLLNNDTQVGDFALDHLIDAMEKDASVGASAPMLLYPNGRLQEAGCILKSNGEGELIGVGGDPDDPRYNYSRPIEYGSGACLMLRRSALDGALFDERFAPAYCEDADLCLRIRSNGWRIVYEPQARVIHHLSVSTTRKSVRKRLQLVRRNQQKLLEKWQDMLRAGNRVRVLAFYLPQFHPMPQNNVWWGKGFTEWTNTTRALPSFAGHYQPHLPADLGFYDLRLVDVLDEQQKLARRYGIEGFVVYYYNFNGMRLLEQPMENLLERPEIDFRFALCWANENWTRHWDGGQRSALLTQEYSEETLDSVIDDFIRFGRDPRAIRVSGKLLVLIYRPLLIPNVAAFAERIRKRFRSEGYGEIQLAYVESMEMLAQNVSPAGIGFDASVEFPPQGIAEPYDRTVEITKAGWQGKLYDYAGTAENSVMRPGPGYNRYAGVAPSWDNTPRQPLSATTLVGAEPEIFQAYLEFKIEETVALNVSDDRLLFINAWNEWAEGAHLEPDRGYGHRWLGSVRNALLSKGIYFDY